MAALLDALRWPAFISEDDTAQAGTENRQGISRFNGEPTRLAEYEFRVRAKLYKDKQVSEDEKKKLGPLGLRLVEGLSGTALRIAQTMDFSELSGDDGAAKLLALLKKELKPKRNQQARELYAAGANPHGSAG